MTKQLTCDVSINTKDNTRELDMTWDKLYAMNMSLSIYTDMALLGKNILSEFYF